MSTPSGVLNHASYIFGLAETSTSTAPGELSDVEGSCGCCELARAWEETVG